MPDQYDFFPKTWIYTSDFHEILSYNERKSKKRAEDIASGIMTPE